MQLNVEQKNALKEIKEWALGNGPNMISLTGPAGSGKSFLMLQAKEYLKGAVWCALTGHAARRLSDVAQVKASTLHSILYKRPEQLKNGELEFNTLNSPSFKYLIVDEASLIGPKIFSDLKQWVTFYKTRILFIGDAFQLPPVLSTKEKIEYTEFTIFSHVKGPELTQVMRNSDEIINVATIIREQNKIPTIGNNAYSLIQTPNPIEYVAKQYLDDPNDHMIITWRNKMRMEANLTIRTKLGYTNQLPYEGEKIIFGRNGQGILNGQIETIKKIVPGTTIDGLITYRVLLEDRKYILTSVTGKDFFMDGQMPFIKNWKTFFKTRKRLNIEEPLPITYGFVNTTHRCQGHEFRRVTMLLDATDMSNPYFRTQTFLPNGNKVPFGIRFFYTALTRAREKVQIVIGV